MRFIFFYLLVPFCVWSQQVINSEEFFKSGMRNFIEPEETTRKNTNFPWVEKYEFRTSTRDSDFSRQAYTVRLSTSSSRIRNAQKAIYDEISNTPNFEWQDTYCNQLMIINNDWLSLYIINENKNLLEQLLGIMNDKKAIYEKMFGTLDIDPAKLLKLKSDRTDIKISLHDLRIQQEYLIKLYGFSTIQIDFSDFITTENITEDLFEKSISDEVLHIKDVEFQYKKSLLDKEMALEAAEGKKVLDFVQVKYSGPHSDLLKVRLSLGLSLQLSNSGSRKIKMQELKIEKENLNRTFERNTNEIQKEVGLLKYKLHADIENYSYLLEIGQEEGEELERLSNNISQSQGTSPFLLLAIKERKLSLKINLLRVKKELLQDYLTYLLKSQRLYQSERVNYFYR